MPKALVINPLRSGGRGRAFLCQMPGGIVGPYVADKIGRADNAAAFGGRVFAEGDAVEDRRARSRAQGDRLSGSRRSRAFRASRVSPSSQRRRRTGLA